MDLSELQFWEFFLSEQLFPGEFRIEYILDESTNMLQFPMFYSKLRWGSMTIVNKILKYNI